MTLLLGSLQLGFIYGILALGVYLTFRILNLPDLTADGSFTLGLSVSAAFTVLGHPYLGIVAAVIAGALAGSVTGILQTKFNIHPILSGILTMSGLYSVNLLVLGNRSNLSLIGLTTIFSDAQSFMTGFDKDIVKLIVVIIVCALAFMVMAWILTRHIGLCIRATGDNADMVRASSINIDKMKIIALAIANAYVALSGAILTQYQGYADISSGTGIVTIGLASVIIGEVFFSNRSLILGLVGAVSGATIYRIIIAIALKNDLFPSYMLKLVSAMIVIIALSIPSVKAKIAFMKMKKEALRDA